MVTIRHLDVSPRPLPPTIEDARYREWNDLLKYFNAVLHHNREAGEVEFGTRLYTFERFVLDRMKPKTSSEQAAIDELIAEAERGN